MNYQFKLQVPISKELNEKLKTKAKEVGFSSVNDVARLLLTNFANGTLYISFMANQASAPYYSPEQLAEIEKIAAEGMAEYERGETIRLDTSKPITKQILDNLD